jgi:hypothetical protein
MDWDSSLAMLVVDPGTGGDTNDLAQMTLLWMTLMMTKGHTSIATTA